MKYILTEPGLPTITQIYVMDEERYVVRSTTIGHTFNICSPEYKRTLIECRSTNNANDPPTKHLDNKNKFLTTYLRHSRESFIRDQRGQQPHLVNIQTSSMCYLPPTTAPVASGRTRMEFGANVNQTKRPRESIWTAVPHSSVPTQGMGNPNTTSSVMTLAPFSGFSSIASSVDGDGCGSAMEMAHIPQQPAQLSTLNDSFASEPAARRQRTDSGPLENGPPLWPELSENVLVTRIPESQRMSNVPPLDFDPEEVARYINNEVDRNQFIRFIGDYDELGIATDFEPYLKIARLAYQMSEGTNSAPF
jgi:hypothetical protein